LVGVGIGVGGVDTSCGVNGVDCGVEAGELIVDYV
jgi:hypothetical protein